MKKAHVKKGTSKSDCTRMSNKLLIKDAQLSEKQPVLLLDQYQINHELKSYHFVYNTKYSEF